MIKSCPETGVHYKTESSINQQFKLFNDRVLPTLDENIKNGNSLIDTDFYDTRIDLNINKKVKPFSWKNSFPNIFSNEGFDIIIGNPPYGALLTTEEDSYYRIKYSVSNYQLDTYNLFVEKGLKLLRSEGFLGFIIPSAWVASKYDYKFRRFIAETSKIERFVITPKRMFIDATVETCIIILSNSIPYTLFSVERWDQDKLDSYSIDIKSINKINNYIFPVYSNESKWKIIEKIKGNERSLQNVADVIWGVKIYENGKGTPPQKGNESINKIFHSEIKTKPTHRPLIGGKEITRYLLNWNKGYVDYGRWLAAPRNPS